MVSGTAVFFALVCIWMSIIVNPFMLVIGFFFLRLSGQGTMSLLSQTLPPQWFEEKRAFAMSLVEVGGVGGAALIPPLNNFLIQNYGATSAWRFWSVLLITVMLPAGWFFIRNKPEDIGEEIDGKSYDENGDKITKKTFKPKVPVSEVDWSLDEAWSTKAYWLMIYCAGMTAMIGTGITFSSGLNKLLRKAIQLAWQQLCLVLNQFCNSHFHLWPEKSLITSQFT